MGLAHQIQLLNFKMRLDRRKAMRKLHLRELLGPLAKKRINIAKEQITRCVTFRLLNDHSAIEISTNALNLPQVGIKFSFALVIKEPKTSPIV